MADKHEAVELAGVIAQESWEQDQNEDFLNPVPHGTRRAWMHFFGPIWTDWDSSRRRGVTENPVVSEPGSVSMSEIMVRLEQAEEQQKRLEAALEEVRTLAEETFLPAELSVVPGLTLRRPIPVVIEEGAGDVVARWIEPGLTGIGGSEGEAMESLADIIADTLADLRSDVTLLSGNTRRMLTVIEAYVATTA